MSDGIALPCLALLAIGLVALAMVWPQGQGARSPAPFGHRVTAMTTPTLTANDNPIPLRGPEVASIASAHAPHPAR